MYLVRVVSKSTIRTKILGKREFIDDVEKLLVGHNHSWEIEHDDYGKYCLVFTNSNTPALNYSFTVNLDDARDKDAFHVFNFMADGRTYMALKLFSDRLELKLSLEHNISVKAVRYMLTHGCSHLLKTSPSVLDSKMAELENKVVELESKAAELESAESGIIRLISDKCISLCNLSTTTITNLQAKNRELETKLERTSPFGVRHHINDRW
jgi:hypothetical protein